MITATGAGTALAGGIIASASGWTSPTGLAAFITALVGAGAFTWSVVQGIRNRRDSSREIDVEAAARLIKAMREADDEA